MNTDRKQVRDNSVEAMIISQEKVEEMSETNRRLKQMKENAEIEKQQLVHLNTELRMRLEELESHLRSEQKQVHELNSRLEATNRQQQQFQQQHQQQTKTSSEDGSTETTTTKVTSVEVRPPRVEDLIRRRETELEQRKVTRYDAKKKIQQETIKMRSSSNESGERREEKSVITTSTATPLIQRNEITIPIYKEGELLGSSKVDSSSVRVNVGLLSPRNDQFSSRTTELVTYKDGEIVDKKVER